MATKRDWIGLAVLTLPCLLYSMDLTVLNLAVPHLTADLAPSSTQLLWIVDIYGFLVAGSLITMGTLGDRIGRRRLLLIGAVAFGCASLLAAFAQTATMLIVARAILGVAAATIAPSTLSLISNMFADPRERTIAVGVWVGAFSAGGALGPMIGGMMLEHLWWGSVFLIAVPVMLLLVVLAPRLLPEFKDPAPGKLDMRSSALSIAAVLVSVYGAKQIAAHGPSAFAFVLIGAGLVLGYIFIARQRRLAHPFIDLALFELRPFAVCLAIYVLGAFAAFGTFVTIAQYLQLVIGLGPLEAGLWTAPGGVVFILGSFVGPRLVKSFDKGRVMSGGLVIAAVGSFVIARCDGALGVLVGGNLLFGFGLSLCFTFAVDLVVASAPPERSGSASALAETGAELGGALGIAILGSIMTYVYRAAMPAGAPDTLAEVATNRPDLLDTARDAFMHSASITATICAVALLAAAVAAAVCLPRATPACSSDAISAASG